MIDRLKAFVTRWGGRGRPAPARALPPGVDEIRLVETPDALRLAELASLLAALDQCIEAMRRLAAEREATRVSADPVADLALLRFAVLQFVSCFKARKRSARLTPKQAFDADGVKFFAHVSAFADQLAGAHPRVVGQAETVVMLRRAGDRAGLLGVVTRTRRPDRLTTPELASLADFMERGRAAYAEAFEIQRARVAADVETLPPDALLALRLLDR